ncbi:MAG TPA: hypothetical protein VFW09_20040 [Solirubrobacteraceae bacterium]|nr:hypothetical protein [Solirubrobacteraceae bacterium]
MQQRDELQPRRVEHLGDRAVHRLVQRMHAGVDQRRSLVVDQELVHRQPELVRPARDPVDAVDDLVDPRLRLATGHRVPFPRMQQSDHL